MSRTPDARLREVMESLGQASGPEKNEVILASDLVGASTLVMMLDARRGGGGGTDAALLGPFFRAHAPALPLGADIARHAPGGEPLVVRGRVRDTSGKPLAG